MDQLADFLGHDIRVQFYRFPEGTLQLAKVRKVLMALDQRRLAEFKGKILDEINIDPDGTNCLSFLTWFYPSSNPPPTHWECAP